MSCEHSQPVHIKTTHELSWLCMDCGEPLVVYLVGGEVTYGDAVQYAQYVRSLKSQRRHRE